MIVKVTEKNLFDAAEVYMKSWKESHKDICSAEFIEKHDFDFMYGYLKDKLNSCYNIYVCYNDQTPVGIVAINTADEEICLLYVDPDQQGKGYGSKLLEYALSLCKNPYITVLDSNKKAIDFYLKRGFIPTKDQPEICSEKRIFECKYVYQKTNM